jgi:hypothetical protein
MDIIIGGNILRQLGIVLDYATNTIRLGQQVTTLTPVTSASPSITRQQPPSLHAPHDMETIPAQREAAAASTTTPPWSECGPKPFTKLEEGDQAFLIALKVPPEDSLSLAAETSSTATDQQLDHLRRQIVTDFADVIRDELPLELPPVHRAGIEMQYQVQLKEGAAPQQRHDYPRSWAEHEAIKKIVTELLQQGIVEPSTSPWASPVLLVKKKTGEYRMGC